MAKLQLTAIVAACLLAGCAGERGLSCESSDRYESARSVAPVRVPDDLSVPDESEALRVPFPTTSDGRPSGDTCLEAPPDFFEGGVGAGSAGAQG